MKHLSHLESVESMLICEMVSLSTTLFLILLCRTHAGKAMLGSSSKSLDQQSEVSM